MTVRAPAPPARPVLVGLIGVPLAVLITRRSPTEAGQGEAMQSTRRKGREALPSKGCHD